MMMMVLAGGVHGLRHACMYVYAYASCNAYAGEEGYLICMYVCM